MLCRRRLVEVAMEPGVELVGIGEDDAARGAWSAMHRQPTLLLPAQHGADIAAHVGRDFFPRRQPPLSAFDHGPSGPGKCREMSCDVGCRIVARALLIRKPQLLPRERTAMNLRSIALVCVLTLCSASAAAAQTWSPFGPNAGEVPILVVSPLQGSNVLAIPGNDYGGLFLSTNSGLTWTSITRGICDAHVN